MRQLFTLYGCNSLWNTSKNDDFLAHGRLAMYSCGTVPICCRLLKDLYCDNEDVAHSHDTVCVFKIMPFIKWDWFCPQGHSMVSSGSENGEAHGGCESGVYEIHKALVAIKWRSCLRNTRPDKKLREPQTANMKVCGGWLWKRQASI